MMSSGSAHVLLVLIAIAIGGPGSALAERNEARVDAEAGASTPAQVAASVTSAIGRARPGINQDTQSLDYLRQMLGVSGEVVLALLRVMEQRDVPPEQSSQALAQAAIHYHEAIGQLAEITAEDRDGQRLITEAQAATTAGHFGDAEVLLRQFEEREAVSSGSSPGGAAEPASVAIQHSMRAAQARFVLGNFAMMKLRYDVAIQDFQLAQQRLALVPAAVPTATVPPADQSAAASELAEQVSDGVPAGGSGAIHVRSISASPAAATAAQLPLTTEVEPALVSPDFRSSKYQSSVEPVPPVIVGNPPAMQELVSAANGASIRAANNLGTVATARGVPERTHPPAVAVVVKLPGEAPAISADVLALLLRRGEALLAVGDVLSARLFYERAAAGGDGRAATGAGKTCDPLFLSEIGARGIQGDPAAAKAWYRRAIDLGDQSAAERLKRIMQEFDG